MIHAIVAFLWVAVFIFALWRLTFAVYDFGRISVFAPFFALIFLMILTSAMYYYEMRTTNIWLILRASWLVCSVWIFISFIRLLSYGK